MIFQTKIAAPPNQRSGGAFFSQCEERGGGGNIFIYDIRDLSLILITENIINYRQSF